MKYEVQRDCETTYAKTYTISKTDCPDADRCWSFCNGIDGFGHADEELDEIRKRHGEILRLPSKPRLILFRRHKNSALEAKIWTLRSFCGDDDDKLLLASVATALIGLPANWFHIDLIDWIPGTSEDCDARFELSIDVCGNYIEFERMKTLHRAFHKNFDKGTWK